jgi:hypothetical protein
MNRGLSGVIVLKYLVLLVRCVVLGYRTTRQFLWESDEFDSLHGNIQTLRGCDSVPGAWIDLLA